MASRPDGKKANWGAIILALVAITIGRLVSSAINGRPDREKPEGIISADELGIDLTAAPIAIDVLNDGQIIVEGSQATLDELRSLVPPWNESRKVISYHREHRSDDPSSISDDADSAISDARLSFSPRTKPQQAEQTAESSPDSPAAKLRDQHE